MKRIDKSISLLAFGVTIATSAEAQEFDKTVMQTNKVKLPAVVEVKNLDQIGLDLEKIALLFGDEITLSLDEVLRIETHNESEKIRIITVDGIIRELDFGKSETPRNLISERR